MRGMQPWLVRVSEDNKHAFNEAFWTKRKALDFIERIQGQGAKWSCELVKLARLA